MKNKLLNYLLPFRAYQQLFVFICLLPLAAIAQKTAPQVATYQQKLEQQTLLFMENKGQVTDWQGHQRADILFSAHSGGAQVFLTGKSISYQFTRTEYPAGYDPHQAPGMMDPKQEEALRQQVKTSTHRFSMELAGASAHPVIVKQQRSAYTENFYLAQGNYTGVHGFEKIIMKEVYPHIDWVIYSKDGYLEYDFLVHEGGDPLQIKMKIKDADGVNITKDGALELKTRLGTVREQAPVSYAGDRVVATRFRQNSDSSISFVINKTVAGELRIDPSVTWATYYGGGGNDYGRSCAVDGSGNVYMAGYTSSNNGIASNGYQSNFSAGTDAFLVKFSGDGGNNSRLWATYYGGTYGDMAYSCAVDGSGNVYLAGYTNSSGLASGGFQNNNGGGSDAFLVKFSGGGSRLWATYYGGSAEDYSYSCAVDGSGNVYLSGYTASTSGIASGGFQNNFGGGTNDAFLVKFSSSGGSNSRLWATYYGGASGESCYSCAVDSSGNVYLLGNTVSTSGIASGGFQPGYGGSTDAFLAKFSSSGGNNSLLWATYFGGPGNETGFACAVDGSDNVYVAGYTSSTSGIASGGFQLNHAGGTYDAILAKFSGNGGSNSLLWATYYGGTGADYGYSCAVDANGNVYLAGYTPSTTGIASGAFQTNNAGGTDDAFLVKFSGNGGSNSRLWGSYYGGPDIDFGYSCAADGNGDVYLAGYTTSITGIASGGFQNSPGGSSDAFLAKINGISCPAGNTLYVDGNIAFSGTGNSWSDAVKTLQEALVAANSCGAVTQIWVKKGTYYPTAYPIGSSGGSTSRDYAFVLKNNLAIYGGFAGTETDTSQRVSGNITVLSGDIGSQGYAGDNCYHVLLSVNCNNTARLDGMTISGARANGGLGSISVGGNTLYKSSGGGMFNVSSSPVITGCSFANNSVDVYGGGMYNYNSSPAINRCSFAGNSGSSGGGIANSTNSSPVITNSTIVSNNVGNVGGGIYYASSSAPILTNCTFSENTTAGSGPGIYIDNSTPVIKNSIIWGSSSPQIAGVAATISYSIVKGLSAVDSTNSIANPLFVNASQPAGADGILGTADDGLRLSAESPAVNAGSNTAATGIATDIAGMARVQQGIVDMGAYESPYMNCGLYSNHIVYVDGSISISGTGVTWITAVKTLQEALTIADSCSSATQIWIKKGTYIPTAYPKGSTGGSTNRDYAFKLKNNVTIYGGFAGTETDTSQRVTGNKTVLSGDIGSQGNTGDNCYHVLISRDNNSTARIDGVTVTGGNANGTGSISISGYSLSRSSGAGMCNYFSNPHITNCSFEGNIAVAGGAGMYDSSSAPIIYACSFISNLNNSNSGGGGMYNAASSPVITNSSFTTNITNGNGGGMYNVYSSSPTIVHCSFINNNTLTNGGGLYNNSSSPIIDSCSFSNNMSSSGGGIFNTSASLPIITNCSFAYNSSNGMGGGITNASSSSATITNCSFTSNTSSNGGGGVCNQSSSPAISNCVFTSNITPANGAGMYNVSSSFATVINCGFSGNNGSGMCNSSSSPTVTNCSFTNNMSTNDGAGMWNTSSSSPVINNCSFANNIGGGMYNNAASVPVITNCSFARNTGNNGGAGMHNASSSPVLTKCIFTGNRNGSGMYNDASSPALTNCLFANDTAVTSGGGMYNTSSSSPLLINCTFFNNYAGNNGPGIYNDNSVPRLRNCIVWGSVSPQIYGSIDSVRYSVVKGLTAISNNNLISDPLFVNSALPAGPDGIFGTADDGLQILCSSPARNAGTATGAPATDILGNARSIGGGVDMGAYENLSATIPSITTATLPDVTAGIPYNASIAVNSGTTPYSYQLNGLLANYGITISNSGVLSGTDSLSLGGTATISVTDAVGCTAKKSFAGTTTYKSNISGSGSAAIWQMADTGSFVATVSTPTAVAIVNIGAAHTVTLNGDATTKTLNMLGTLVDNGNTLTLTGNLSGKGTHNGSGKIIMSGNTVTSYINSLSAADTLKLGNIQLNDADGFTLANNVKILQKLTLTAGVLNTSDAAASLVFASNNTANGRLGQTGGGSVNGSVTVERYVPAKRAWRLLTAPLSSTGSIYQNWQNNGISNGMTGVDIWSPTGGAGLRTGGNSASMQRFNTVTSNWLNLTNTMTTSLSGAGAFAANQGFSLFVGGPYGYNATFTYTPALPTTLKAKGKPQTGDQNFSFSVADTALVLLGNPYISAVDFAKATKTNMANKFWAWDAERSGTSYGGYVTVSVDVNNVVDIDFPYNLSKQRQTIQNGEAVLVMLYPGSPSITFHEADKVDSFTNAVFKTTGGTAQTIRTFLKREIGSTMTEVDATYAKFSDDYSAATTDDADKFYNYDENMALRRGAAELAIERRPSVTQYDTLFYNLYALKQNEQYSLQLSPDQWSNSTHEAWLVDTYLDSSYHLDMQSSNNEYGFATPANIQASYDAGRFYLVFHALGATPLAVKDLGITARKAGRTVVVNWDTKNEQNMDRYELEKSADGKSFVYLTTAPAHNTATASYTAIDNSPVNGANYYRIKAIGTTGNYSYSKTVQLLFSEDVYTLNVFPNPVTDGTIRLSYAGMPEGSYGVMLYDAAGKMVFAQSTSMSGSGMAIIKPSQPLAAGVYQLSVASETMVYGTVTVLVK